MADQMGSSPEGILSFDLAQPPPKASGGGLWYRYISGLRPVLCESCGLEPAFVQAQGGKGLIDGPVSYSVCWGCAL